MYSDIFYIIIIIKIYLIITHYYLKLALTFTQVTVTKIQNKFFIINNLKSKTNFHDQKMISLHNNFAVVNLVNSVAL